MLSHIVSHIAAKVHFFVIVYIKVIKIIVNLQKM